MPFAISQSTFSDFSITSSFYGTASTTVSATTGSATAGSLRINALDSTSSGIIYTNHELPTANISIQPSTNIQFTITCNDNALEYAVWPAVWSSKPDPELKKAELLSFKLLSDHLSYAQRRSLRRHNYFEVESELCNVYRLHKARSNNVKLLDKHRNEVKSFCIHPSDVPVGDVLLAQKLWLETMEEKFIETANKRETAVNIHRKKRIQTRKQMLARARSDDGFCARLRELQQDPHVWSQCVYEPVDRVATLFSRPLTSIQYDVLASAEANAFAMAGTT